MTKKPTMKEIKEALPKEMQESLEAMTRGDAEKLVGQFGLGLMKAVTSKDSSPAEFLVNALGLGLAAAAAPHLPSGNEARKMEPEKDVTPKRKKNSDVIDVEYKVVEEKKR